MEILNAGYANYSTTGVSSSSPDSLTQNDFLKLLTSELGNQDPFNPMDTSEMLNQVMMLQELESSSKMNETLDELIHQGRMSSAASMLGTTVRGVDSAGTEQIGVVTGLAVTGDLIELILNGDPSKKLAMGNVSDVKLTIVGES